MRLDLFLIPSRFGRFGVPSATIGDALADVGDIDHVFRGGCRQGSLVHVADAYATTRDVL
jgi:hypothetical protein